MSIAVLAAREHMLGLKKGDPQDRSAQARGREHHTSDPAQDRETVANKIAGSIDKERRALLGFIRSRVETVEEAEDILQDVVYQLLRSGDAMGTVEDVTAWLYTVARNRIVDWYRKRKHTSLDAMEEGDDAIPIAIADAAMNPEQVLTRETIWDAFVDALAELPEKQRDVFVMHELEGKSFAEIAEATGDKLNTLLSRKRYAVLALRELLGPLYHELFVEE